MGPRLPAIVASERHLADNNFDKIVSCYVGFSMADWSVPIRGAIQKVASGAISYRWFNRYRGSYFDTFPLGLTFQSGNIMSQVDEQGNTVVPPGLKDFYKFLELCNEPPLMASGRENFDVIVHTGIVFPSIVLKGWLTPEGTAWQENTTEGFTHNWTAKMEVVSSVPRLHDAAELTKMYAAYSG
jgi:hypothetical protein